MKTGWKIWKKIVGFDYEVSNTGEIRNDKRKKIKPNIRGTNITFNLYDKQKKKYVGFHLNKLLLEYFNIEKPITDDVEDLSGEVWKKVIGFEDNYVVSSKGRVKSINFNNTKSSQILKPTLNKKGYCVVSLHKDNKKHSKLVHRITLEAFKEKVLNKNQVNHINGIKTDNNIYNLEWVDNSENQQHAIDIGLKIPPVGIEVHNHRSVYQLSLSDFRIIKKWDTITEASKYFKIPTTNICKVCKGTRGSAGGYSWKYVEEISNFS